MQNVAKFLPTLIRKEFRESFNIWLDHMQCCEASDGHDFEEGIMYINNLIYKIRFSNLSSHFNVLLTVHHHSISVYSNQRDALFNQFIKN
jgi:hypothetical protein